MPWKKNHALSIRLQLCLEDIKAWTSLNALLFNQNKTELMVFGLSGFCEPYPVESRSPGTAVNQIVSNLDFRVRLPDWSGGQVQFLSSEAGD